MFLALTCACPYFASPLRLFSPTSYRTEFLELPHIWRLSLGPQMPRAGCQNTSLEFFRIDLAFHTPFRHLSTVPPNNASSSPRYAHPVIQLVVFRSHFIQTSTMPSSSRYRPFWVFNFHMLVVCVCSRELGHLYFSTTFTLFVVSAPSRTLFCASCPC